MLAAMDNAAQCSASPALQPTVRWPLKDGQLALTMRGRRVPAFARAPLLKCRAQPSRRMLVRIGPQPSHASCGHLCAPTFEVSRPRRAQPGAGRLDRMVRCHLHRALLRALTRTVLLRLRCWLSFAPSTKRGGRLQ